jgi:hypothetical protein
MDILELARYVRQSILYLVSELFVMFNSLGVYQSAAYFMP